MCPTAANHSLDNGCKAAGSYGGEPLCCGEGCGIPSCSNALWPGETRALFGGAGAGTCGAIESNDQTKVLRGVLCCQVESANPSGPSSFERPRGTDTPAEMLVGGAITQTNGFEPKLGKYREISRVWSAGYVPSRR